MIKGGFKEKYFLSYKQIINYLKDSKKYVYFSILIFFIFVLIGFFLKLPGEITSQLLQYFNDLILKTKGYSFFDMCIFLFQNNLFASFFGMIGGILFGIFPLLNSMVNGVVLGFVANLSVNEAGILSLFRIIPHGIFELPALFICLGLGLKLGSKFLEKYLKIKSELKQLFFIFFIGFILLIIFVIFYSLNFGLTNLFIFFFIIICLYYFLKESELKKELIYAVNTFFLVVIPLLFFAAIIEAFLIIF